MWGKVGQNLFVHFSRISIERDVREYQPARFWNPLGYTYPTAPMRPFPGLQSLEDLHVT
jgi:hypothetical protein